MKNINLFTAILIIAFFTSNSLFAQWEYNTPDEIYYAPATGKVGIGVTNPSNYYRLHVDGKTTNATNGIYSIAHNGKIAIFGRSTSGKGVYGSTSTGYGVYGYTSNSLGTGVYGFASAGKALSGRTSYGYAVHGLATSNNGHAGYFTGKVEVDGKVSIGTSNTPTTVGGEDISDYNLFVEGGILADEIRVRNNWADYVFASDYELKPLNLVQKHIKEKGHLPNVPSEKEVENKGLQLGEMTKIQQEKIEELFLYVIELDKQAKSLKTENRLLLKRIKQLEQKVQ